MMASAPIGGPLMGVASLDAIIRHAKHVPVFPCRARSEEGIKNGKPHTYKAKSPHTDRGFLNASQDEAQIRAWWRTWPDALVGVPTGKTSGLVVIDYDPDKHCDDTGEWIEQCTELLLSARVHTTARGGRHYLYRLPAGQGYRGGVDLVLKGKKRPGIDVRADGGYIIWWPLHGGMVTNEKAPLLPAGLIDERSFEFTSAPPRPRATPSPEAWSRDKEMVVDALSHLDPANYDQWLHAGMAIHQATAGNDEGFDLWHAFSSGGITGETPSSYAGIEDCRYRWNGFSSDRKSTITLGSVFHMAKDAGYVMPRAVVHHGPAAELPVDSELPPVPDDDRFAPPEGSSCPTEKAKAARRSMDWTALATRTPPVRTWRISHWLTTGPTLLAGRGGIGKTLMAQTIATALALKARYLDDIHAADTVLFWACEDEHDELWRRQVQINKYFECDMEDLQGKLIIEPRIGMDNTLFTTSYGAPAWTPLRDELRAQIGDYKAGVVFLDNIGQTFGGKENDRHHVTTFCNGLAGIAGQDLSLVLMGHPAKATDSEFSGSTAWENAVRMRWYMGTDLPDKADEESAPEDPNVRYLCKRKANYSVKDWIKLAYKDGVFTPEKEHDSHFQRAYGSANRNDGADACVLHALERFKESGIRTTDGRTSPDYLPKKMAEAKLASDYSKRELGDALMRLRMSGKVGEGVIGKYENRTVKRGLVVM